MVVGLLLFAQLITGRIVDADTHVPLAGVPVAIAANTQKNQMLLAGDRAPVSRNVSIVTSALDGTITFGAPSPVYLLTAYGSALGKVPFHGIFARDAGNIGSVRLLTPTAEERATLARINAFRTKYGVKAELVFDENLMESARYWAELERKADRIGHTCATLGHPDGCIEFNDFYHGLPGAPQDWLAGQDVAFDTVLSWNDPESGFEDEGRLCDNPYDWKHCSSGDRETGHFKNIMQAQQWMGLGKQLHVRGGAYFAMNVI